MIMKINCSISSTKKIKQKQLGILYMGKTILSIKRRPQQSAVYIIFLMKAELDKNKDN